MAVRGYDARLARPDDLAALRALMHDAMAAHLPVVLTPEQTQASYEIMGLDTQLIEDGSYFAIEEAGALAAAGGWSFRKTLFGGDHSEGRSAERLDPATDAARLRAMYVARAHARKGLGRWIVELSEDAARRAGFRRMELVATMSGLPLYETCGYAPIRRFSHRSSAGVEVPLVAMSRML